MSSDSLPEEADGIERLPEDIESQAPGEYRPLSEPEYNLKRRIEERLERKRLIEEFGFIEDF